MEKINVILHCSKSVSHQMDRERNYWNGKVLKGDSIVFRDLFVDLIF